MAHSVLVNVSRTTDGSREKVLQSRHCHIPRRILKKLFGNHSGEVLVLVPGDSVSTIVIREEKKEGEAIEAL